MSMQQVYERAAADPDFAERLKSDFVAAIKEAGIEVSPQEIKSALGVQDASDRHAVEELQRRLSKSMVHPRVAY